MTSFSSLCAGVSLAAAVLSLAAAPSWAGRQIVRGGESEIATTFQIDPAHDGNINFAAGFAPPLKQAWSRDIIYNTEGAGLGSVIADGAVFVSADGALLRLSLDKGHTDFQKSGTSAFITYDNGLLFSLTQPGILTALTQDKAKKVWSIQLPHQTFFTAMPNAVNGQVFVTGDGVGGDVYAVDEATGHLNWDFAKLRTGAESPAFGDNALFVANSCQYYSFDPVTGKQNWRNFFGNGAAHPTPIFSNHQMLIPDNCGRFGGAVLNAADGTRTGKFNNMAPYAPAVFQNSKGITLGVNVQYDLSLHCWNASTGKQLWLFKGPTAGLLNGAPIVINGIIYVADQEGDIYALSENGTQLWTAKAPANGTYLTLTAGQGTLVLITGSIVTAFVPQ